MRYVLEEDYNGTERPGMISHVAHIGTMSGADLARWLRLPVTAVTVAVADPAQAADLRRQTDDPRLRIIDAAVTADPDRRTFLRMTPSDLSGLRKPTGLSSLFPGLRVLLQLPVEPVDPADFITGLSLNPQAENLLVLKMPGEALGILNRLHSVGLLSAFSAVMVQEGRMSLYEDAGTTEDVLGCLRAVGFAAHETLDSPDLDRPILEAWRDATLSEAQVQTQALKAERAELCEALSKAQVRAIAESDLVELQTRYVELRDAKDQQDALLVEVTSHLQALTAPAKPRKPARVEAKSAGRRRPPAKSKSPGS